MSSKIGTILSFVFIALFIVLGVDMMSIQYVYSDLDSKSTSIAYLIAQNGTVNDSLITTIENRYNVEFTCLDNCNSVVGDIVPFEISTTYKPIIISKEVMTIKVKREAIIGYYD